MIVDPQLYCRACFHCRIGQTHLCKNGMLVGRDTDGGFAEFVSIPPSHVFPLPASVDTRTAPLIQVLTTCLHAQRQIDIFPGEFVVVLGLGVTGQLHVQLAKARGATVIGVTRSADKRALADTLGADLTIAGGEGAVARVREATDGRGADVIIETTGVVPSLSSAIDMARSGGRLLLFGIITARKGRCLSTICISRSSPSSTRASPRPRTIRRRSGSSSAARYASIPSSATSCRSNS